MNLKRLLIIFLRRMLGRKPHLFENAGLAMLKGQDARKIRRNRQRFKRTLSQCRLQVGPLRRPNKSAGVMPAGGTGNPAVSEAGLVRRP